MTTNQNNQADPKAPPPQSEAQRIIERKRKVIDTLQAKFMEPIWRERLLKICGGDESRILKSMNSFFAYIMNDEGAKDRDDDKKSAPKKLICDCSISTISGAFLEAFQMGIEVGGGRDHAYLVNYANKCELEISYKGFVYALGKHFDNPFVMAENVFDGDEFTSQITNNNATFTYTPKDPFSKSWEKMRGCFCFFSYTQRDNKEKVSRLVMIQKSGPDGLEMIRSKAKSSFAWKDFPFEQTKKSTLRRAAKIPFATIDFGDEEISPESVDNRHYVLEASSSDRLALLMQKQKELGDDDKPKDPESKSEDKKDGGAPAQQKVPETDTQADAAGAHADPGAVNTQPMDDSASYPEGAIIENGDPTYEDLSAEDFVGANGTPAITDPKVQSADPIVNASQAKATPVAVPEAGGEVWDGKTIFVAPGKPQQRDFATAQAAFVYLKKVISSRNHKATRLELISLNPLLMAALVKQGYGSSIAELHKIADQGI